MDRVLRKITVILSILAGLIVISIILLVLYKINNQDSLSNVLCIVWVDVLVGMAASMLASVICLNIQGIINRKQKDEISEIVFEEIKKTNELYNLIIDIHRKDHYQPQYWINLISETENRLDLSGHTLHKWVEGKYKGVFEFKIVDMMNKKSMIRILFSKDDFNDEKIKTALGNKSERGLSKKEKTIYALLEIIKRNNLKNKSDNLCIVLSDSSINYMYVRTDNKCIISPYFISKNCSIDKSLLIEVKIESKFEEDLANDFNECIIEGHRIVIGDYLK